jgi:hypothetical protein
MNKSRMLWAVCACLTVVFSSVNASPVDGGAYTGDLNASSDWLRCGTKTGQANDSVIDEQKIGGLYNGWHSANVAEGENSTGSSDFNNHRGSGPDNSEKEWNHSTASAGHDPDNHSSSKYWNIMVEASGSDVWSNKHYKDQLSKLHDGYIYGKDDHCGKASFVPIAAASMLLGSGLLRLLGIAQRKEPV